MAVFLLKQCVSVVIKLEAVLLKLAAKEILNFINFRQEFFDPFSHVSLRLLSLYIIKMVISPKPVKSLINPYEPRLPQLMAKASEHRVVLSPV